MLPKFLFADNSQETPDSIYVVHTENPRCIFECPLEEDFIESNTIYWIDPEPDSKSLVESLTMQADTFLDAELDNQEDLYDVDEEEDD